MEITSMIEITPIINLILIAILVIITWYYAKQTKVSTDISRMALLYQRKPYVVAEIENISNKIFCNINCTSC